MRPKVSLFPIVILTYINSVNSSLKDDEEQHDIYNKNLRGKPIVSDFCKIEPELLANVCTLVLNHIVKESKYYNQMYLHYPAFNTNERNSDKCENTKLFVPIINEHVHLKHLICHGRPIIIRTDEPNEEFSDKISIYIPHTKNVIVLEKIEKRKHKLLKSIYTSISLLGLINGLLTLPSPQSTFRSRAIKAKMVDAETFSNYEKTGNNILRDISKYNLVRICYMLFSRSEYENEVKLLPEQSIQQMRRGRPRTRNSLIYFFSNAIKFKVTMYICPIFEDINSNFKLIAGPGANSVIVVKFTKGKSKPRPYELIENISLEFLNYQVRI